ncbi:secreted RxLR effector protein 161-like [Lotus japonicus]|uniref:secreted RxLR effector protein 161-like n=1 Tax=Lotus japonicus TaxID=34305 RepID=UPI00258D834A|nr:secreted RxLR effector protein 161-like [Lotus japonicus]
MTTTNTGLPANIPVLNGKNWNRWNVQMKAIMGFQEVLEIVENEFSDLSEVNLKLDKCETESLVDATEYRQMVGSLRFICHTRPEISFSVGMVSRFMSEPRHSHQIAAKRILRYLKATLSYGIMFPVQDEKEGLHLVAYSDSDWCGDLVDRKSTMRYILTFAGAPISWCSKKQSVVALSTCEAEYISACSVACQAL